MDEKIEAMRVAAQALYKELQPVVNKVFALAHAMDEAGPRVLELNRIANDELLARVDPTAMAEIIAPIEHLIGWNELKFKDNEHALSNVVGPARKALEQLKSRGLK